MASINLKGDTSGEVTISAPSVAGTTTLELPATSSTLATQNSLGVRNLIINGDMRIAQRGTSVTGVTGGNNFVADRFMWQVGTAGTWTLTQDTDVPTGQGFANSMKLACTTANASLSAGSYGLFLQRIEGLMLQHLKKGTSSAEKLTVSFWIKSNKTGTLQSNLRDVDNTRLIGKEFTISVADTWEKKTITFDGDTSGAFDNDNGLSVQWEIWFVAGSDYSGSGSVPTAWEALDNTDRYANPTINLADSTSNYINITGVQLEVGTEATPFEHRPYDMELQRCQRYFFQPPNAYTDVTGFNYGGGAYSAVFFPTTMRATPFVTNLGGTIWYQGGSTYTFTYINASSTTAHTRLHGSVSGGLNGGAGTFYPYFRADAEL